MGTSPETPLFNGLPQFKCHKTVRATKIIDIQLPDEQVSTIAKLTTNNGDIFVEMTWMGKHHPKRGGYFVVYDDNYQSYSPEEQFEGGYVEQKESDGTSIGEVRVRTKFNPSNDGIVDRIKQKTAELINLCEELKASGKDARLASIAQTEYETAAMYAVKAATS